MTWEKLTRGVVFLAGMLTGGGAAHLFYNGYIASGSAYLVMTALFLWIATRPNPNDSAAPARGIVDDAALVEMALLLGDVAVAGLKAVGRTIPPSTREIDQLEGRLNDLLDQIGAPSSRRTELREEFEKLKGRMRRNEGGIALARSARL
ncbi:MAG: hypothetical protein IJU98_02965 [Synergistaceae bacterium]|nr:hypothetical protein [Synergistaceae bacterium]